MFPSNAHYGHRSLLTAYAGVADGTPLPGLLQHGWNHDLGAILTDINLPLPDPFYTWNQRNIANCQRIGLQHVATVGSPYLYLPAPATTSPAPPKSLLAIPVHSWEREKIPHDFKAYADSLATLRSEFSAISVCLYWFDHQFAANRAPFEAHGFQVITVGHRDGNPTFLPDMRKILRQHAFCTSNRVQTGLFYALHEGLPTFLFGPPMGLDGRYDHSGQLWDAWQRQEFATLAYDRFGGDCQSAVADAELGASYRRSAEELKSILLWQADQQPQLAETVRRHQIRQARGLAKRWHQLSGNSAAAACGPSPALAAARHHGALL